MDSSAEVVIRTTSPTSRWTRCASRARAMSCASGQRWAGACGTANPPCVQIPKTRANQPPTTAFPSPRDPNPCAIVPLPSPVVPADVSPRSGVARVATARAGLTPVAILADGTVVAGSDGHDRGVVPPAGNLRSGRPPRGRRPHAHDAAVTALATCGGGPGEILVSAGGDGAIVAWERLDETNTIQKRRRSQGKARHAHLGPVHGLAASADGSMLVSVGEDGYVCVWSAPVGARGSNDDAASSRKHRVRDDTPLAERAGEDVRRCWPRSASSGARASARSRWGLRAVTLPFWKRMESFLESIRMAVTAAQLAAARRRCGPRRRSRARRRRPRPRVSTRVASAGELRGRRVRLRPRRGASGDDEVATARR